MNTDITSANAVIIYQDNFFALAGIVLQKFSTDQSLSTDEVQMAETRMGVDGKMAAGYTPAIVPVTIVFEADSPSYAFLERSIKAARATKRPLQVTLNVTVPSLRKNITYKNGIVKSVTGLSMKKVIDPFTIKMEFESVS